MSGLSTEFGKEKRRAERISIRGITAWLIKDHSLLGAVANMTPFGALIVGTNFLEVGDYYAISLRFDEIFRRHKFIEIDVQIMWQEEIDSRLHAGISLKPHPEEVKFLEQIIEHFSVSPWD